jgi:hypothetical protein
MTSMTQARVFLAACLAALVQIAFADTPALTITGGNSTVGHSGNSSTTMGWRFDVDSTITITALGYYDALGDGLLEAHAVGVFDAAGSFLASASVPAGTAGTLIDSFRYSSIAPLMLPPGAYTIGGTIGADAMDAAIYSANGPVTVAGISIPVAASRYTESGSYTLLTYPDLNWPPANIYLGPNFEVLSVPEPSQALLLLVGLLALLPKFLKRLASV